MTMMPTPSDPERWSDLPAGAGDEAKFGAALRAAALGTLPITTARVPVVLVQGAPPSRRWLRVAIAIGCAVMGGAVWAMHGVHFNERGAAPTTMRPRGEAPAPAGPLIEVVPTPAPATAESTEPHAAAPAPFGAKPRVRLAARDEATLLWSAFRQLRQRHDARGALDLLEQHRRRFPTSALRIEADLARAEALVHLDRASEAAAVLQGLPPEIAAPARRRLGIPP
jgi:hypothetical protein